MTGEGGKTLSRLMDKAYLEVMPDGAIVERLIHIPRHSYVAITCSQKAGIEATLRVVEELRALPDERRLKLIPHIAARMVRGKTHLREIVARLDAADVRSVFVPGGDAPERAGSYPSALDLLRDLAGLDHSFAYIGVAAHPEGHSLVSDADLVHLLLQKQEVANYLVTQICFDPNALIRWLRLIRSEGVGLQAWIGLPGVVETTKLIALSLRIGVGQSVRVLRQQKGFLRRALSVRPYQPDELLDGLRGHVADPALDIGGFHLFSFNNVEATEKWRTKAVERYSAG
jgi:methylenetetrahydrofolate reductase (NADPH)